MSVQPLPPGTRGAALVPRLVPVPDPTPGAWQPPEPRDGPAELTRDYVQGTLAVDFARPAEDSFFGPQATCSIDLPEPTGWADRMIRLILEAIDGLRPAQQLSRAVSPALLAGIARRGQVSRRRRLRQQHPVRVRASTCCIPADGVAEISLVVQHHGRVRAVAMRMTGVDGRWLVTALQLG